MKRPVDQDVQNSVATSKLLGAMPRAAAGDLPRLRALMDLVSDGKAREITFPEGSVAVEDRNGVIHTVRLADGYVAAAPKPDPLAGQMEMFS